MIAEGIIALSRQWKKILWRLSMKWIVFAYMHFLPVRMHELAAPGEDGWHSPYGFAICPEKDRWKLHTLAAAPPDHPRPDYTFWVRPVEPRDFGYWMPAGIEADWFKVYEVESGGYAFGKTPKEALSNYWKDDDGR